MAHHRPILSALALAVLALILSCLSAKAAFIGIQTSATSFDSLSNFPVGSSDFDTSSLETSGIAQTNDSTSSFKTNSPGSDADGQLQLSTAAASGSANAVTGELKASTATSYSGYYAENFTSASSIVDLSEVFDVVGAGTVTAYLDFHGTYSLTGIGFPFPTDPNAPITVPNVTFQIGADVRITQGAQGAATLNDDPANACAAAGGCTSASGTINDLLIVSLFVSDNVSPQLIVSSRLIAQQFTGSGFIDLSNTGRLFVSASPGLTLTPFDARFLSDPAFVPTAVPEPASWVMFGAGLLGLGLWSRRWKRRASPKSDCVPQI